MSDYAEVDVRFKNSTKKTRHVRPCGSDVTVAFPVAAARLFFLRLCTLSCRVFSLDKIGFVLRLVYVVQRTLSVSHRA